MQQHNNDNTTHSCLPYKDGSTVKRLSDFLQRTNPSLNLHLPLCSVFWPYNTLAASKQASKLPRYLTL